MRLWYTFHFWYFTVCVCSCVPAHRRGVCAHVQWVWSVVVCGTGCASNYLGIMCGLVDPSVECIMRKMPCTASLNVSSVVDQRGFPRFPKL